MIYRRLTVASEPSQECLPHFRQSPNGESPSCSQGPLCLSARVTWCLNCTVLGGHLSLLDATIVMVGHFVPLLTERDPWDKTDAFLSVSDSQYPHSMAGRLRVGSGTSQDPLSDSPLGYILRNWNILTLQKGWPQYKLGEPTQKSDL